MIISCDCCLIWTESLQFWILYFSLFTMLYFLWFFFQNGKTALHYAAYKGQAVAVKALGEAGADLDVTDEVEESWNVFLVYSRSFLEWKIVLLSTCSWILLTLHKNLEYHKIPLVFVPSLRNSFTLVLMSKFVCGRMEWLLFIVPLFMAIQMLSTFY